ncbi:MAG: hypothetical protein ABIM74_05890 [candidate division WOR-3 bacterium]
MTLLAFIVASDLSLNMWMANPKPVYMYGEAIYAFLVYRNVGKDSLYLAVSPIGDNDAFSGPRCLVWFNALDREGKPVRRASPIWYYWRPPDHPSDYISGVWLQPGDSFISLIDVSAFLRLWPTKGPFTLLGFTYGGTVLRLTCRFCYQDSITFTMPEPFVFSVSEEQAPDSVRSFWAMDGISPGPFEKAYGYGRVKGKEKEYYEADMSFTLDLLQNRPNSPHTLRWLWTFVPSVGKYKLPGITPSFVLDSLRKACPDCYYLSDEFWRWVLKLKKGR